MGYRLGNHGDRTELLIDNHQTEYEQVCSFTLDAFSWLILNLIIKVNSAGPYTYKRNELKTFFVKLNLCLSEPFQSTREVTAVLFIHM